MATSKDAPEDIYYTLLNQVRQLTDALGNVSQDHKLGNRQNFARQILQDIERNLHDTIGQLRQNAEWKVFTAAFYGETNAGKSTLIETLRIVFGERTKTEHRQQFRDLQNKLGLTEDQLRALDEEIEAWRVEVGLLGATLASVSQRFDLQQTDLDNRVKELRQRIDTHHRTASWLQRLLNLFRKLPELQVLKEAEAQIRILPAQRDAAIARAQLQHVQAQQQLDSRISHREASRVAMSQLLPVEDGAIIGDGRSDFTRTTLAYTFEVDGQHFRILDVPGIEGDETLVGAEVDKAVQGAHAVFYITSKSTRPQTGDPGRPGTLEKIKKHLGAQTEVWTVLNKRVTNPMALQKSSLLSNDEQAGLNDLNDMLDEQFGENYREVLSLSALPAFLAVADCLAPVSVNAASRRKFLDALSSDSLLEASGFSAFHQRLTQEVFQGGEKKIQRANRAKVRSAVVDVSTAVAALHQEQFAPLASELEKEERSANRQLSQAFRTLKSRLEGRGSKAIGQFEEAVRRRIYGRIDSNIGNDAFKNSLQEILEHEQETMSAALPAQLELEIDQFQQRVGTIIERFQQHAQDILASYEALRQTNVTAELKLDINIDSGLKMFGLVGSLAATIAMILSPAGWVMMSLVAITALVGVFKALQSYFSDDYKKGQQRKAADENLTKTSKAIRHSFQNSLREALEDLESKVEDVRGVLKVPVTQARSIEKALAAAQSGLTKLARSV